MNAENYYDNVNIKYKWNGISLDLIPYTFQKVENNSSKLTAQ